MNNNIQCSIESSTTKIELNSAVDGVFLVPELEGLVGLPEIRTTSGVNAGYDGGWTSAQNYDARLISIRGVIANPDISKVEDKRRAIASLLGQGRKEQLTLRFTTEAGNAYAISVRTISCEMALQRVLTTQEFLIQLRADDPLIYDDGTTGGIAAILQPQRALGGFEINFGLPLAIGGGAEDTVVDNGNETVYPVIKLYGALHSPTVVNRTTNQQMQILADLQYSIDWHTYRSATGDYILVNDGLNGAPMTLSQLLGNAEQTTYSGKNLFNINATPSEVALATYTITDNAIRVVASSSSGTSRVIIPITLAPNTQYRVSFTSTVNTRGGTPSASFRLRVGSTSYGVVNLDGDTVGASVKHEVTFTTTSDTTGLGVWFYVRAQNNTDASDITFKDVQVELGNTTTAYEPYCGGIPSPNPDYPQTIETVTSEQTVRVTGKNLVEDTISGSSIDGIGRIRSNSDFDTQVAFVIEGETYTLSYTGEIVVGGYFATKPTMNSVSIDGTRIVNNNKTFVAQYTGYFTFRTNAGESNAQCELGSTATAYEPYQGQESEVNLGKNLFDKNGANGRYQATLSITGESIKATATNNNTGYVAIAIPNSNNLLGKSCTISYNAQASVGVARAALYCASSSALASVLGSYIIRKDGNGDQTISFTFPSAYETGANCFVLLLYIQSTSSITAGDYATYSNIQLEKGSQATTYAPYFTPIELAKIGTYQDRIYKNDGKWYIEKNVGKVVFDGSEAWSGANSNAYYYRTLSDAIILPSSAKMPPVISDYYTPATRDYLWSRQVDYGVGLYDGAIARVSIRNKDCANSDALKTWLSTHPTTVYYALATPTTTEITDETLLLQLNFLASLYKGENNISLVGTGAQGEMVIRYATDYTVNQDVITIDSQARTITLNGQDVYHLKTSESEFLVLAPGENKLYLTSEVSDDSGYAEVKFKQGYLSI